MSWVQSVSITRITMAIAKQSSCSELNLGNGTRGDKQEVKEQSSQETAAAKVKADIGFKAYFSQRLSYCPTAHHFLMLTVDRLIISLPPVSAKYLMQGAGSSRRVVGYLL